jgi:hypothetical protein
MRTIHFSMIFLIIFLILTASTCSREDENCHFSISIINNSSDTILYAIPIANPFGKCRLDGEKIKPKSTGEYFPYNFCIEDRLVNDSMFIILYIVDPRQYNNPDFYYSYDSIEIKNKVLKKYEMNISDLKRNNFTIAYP